MGLYRMTKAACISMSPRLGTGQCHLFVMYVVLKASMTSLQLYKQH